MTSASPGTSISLSVNRRNPLAAVTAAGLVAGSVDLAQAYLFFGRSVPFLIAGGLIGRQAFQRGAGTYVLGLLLHFFIAWSVAAVYYIASRRLPFLIEYPVICGLVFGAAVEEVMHLVVLPLSALHIRGPFKLEELVVGLLVHMVTVGLPISLTIRHFAKQSDVAHLLSMEG